MVSHEFEAEKRTSGRYVPKSLKKDLAKLKDTSRRITESRLIEEALVIALPTLRKSIVVLVLQDPFQLTDYAIL